MVKLELKRGRTAARFLLIFLVLGALLVTQSAQADPYPPYWQGGTGPSIHYTPAPWAAEPANLVNCGQTCGQWIPYTRYQNDIDDPRTQDPSNGGTAPQNYVNISSSCIDQTYPSIYYFLDMTHNVLMFRWRVEQIANTYATGPNAGAYGDSDPWNSALWTVFFDLNGDGYRDLAAHLDGSSGTPSASIDRLVGIWGNTTGTQSLDYVNDPNIHALGHNPTAFVDGPNGTDRILNFQEKLTPITTWPNGNTAQFWDYGTSRSEVITKKGQNGATCDEYFVDYQIPLGLLDASALGGPKLNDTTPFSMLFCTGNSLNDPLQKDCAYQGSYTSSTSSRGPFGDYVTFEEGLIKQPIVTKITASGCGPTLLSTEILDTITLPSGVFGTSVTSVGFYYYYDKNANGLADDGSTWTFAANGTLQAGSLTTWNASWNTSAVVVGQYLIGVQSVDNATLNNDGLAHRTFSYLTKAEVAALTPPAGEAYYANPNAVGVVIAKVGNSCGLKPAIAIAKAASPTSVPETGGSVTFTFTVSNTGGIPLTISSLTDSVFGTLAGSPTCKVGTLLAPAATCSFTYTTTLTGSPGTPHTNTVSVGAVDNFGNTVIGTGTATVTFTDVLPAVSMTKSANPTSVPQTGGNVTFTFTVTNIGSVPARITSLTDSVFGTLAGGPGCLVGTTLAPAAACNFTLIQFLSGTPGTPHTNTATVNVVDAQNNPASASGSATVSFTSNLPLVTMAKSANPTSVPETGGSVTFTFTVTNTGPVNATITSLTDSVFGTLAGSPTCQVGTVLAPTVACNFTYTTTLSGAPETPHTNTVTVGVVDSLGNPAAGSGSATVTFSDVLPVVSVTKSPNPLSVPETGGSVTFTFVVTNSGTVNATIASLDDSAFGTLAGSPTCQVGTPLAPSATCTFTYTTTLTGTPGTPHTNTVTASVVDAQGNPASASATANVTFSDVLPAVSVTKSPNPASVPETGGSVTFNFVVTNSGAVNATINSLVDSAFGNLAGDADCQVGTLLAPAASCSFAFITTLSGTPGTPHTNTITVGVVDAQGNPASGAATATVNFTPVAPSIQITKSANPTSVPETGGNVAFTFVVSNTGQKDVTLNSLVDSVFGDLNGKGTCVVPQTIPVGGSFTCAYTVFLSSDTLTPHTNVVTANAVDNNGTPATSTASATVTFTNVPPQISITKVATPTFLPVTGGNVTFTFVVQNTGQENVTLTTLNDSVFGDLNGKGNCSVPQAIPVGGSYTCAYTLFLTSGGLPTHTNTVTATGVDNEGTPATSSASETVTFTEVADLSIAKQVSTANAVQGQTILYTLVVTNNGPSTATAVSVSDQLPAGLSFVSSVPTQTSGPNPFVWSLGDLASGQSATVTVQAVVTAASGTLNNAATVSSTTIDPVPGNNTASATTTVLIPGLAVQKSVSIGEVVRNMPFSYTIRIENTGQVPLTPLTITDTLPTSFHFISGSATPQPPDLVAEPTLKWNDLGPLAVGQAITVTIGVTATPGVTGTYNNTVNVLGGFNCVGQAVSCGSVKGTATASVAVADPRVAIVKSLASADLDNVAPNFITFTIDVENVGASIIDILPLVDVFESNNLSFVSASVAPNSSTASGGVGTLTWTDLTAPTNGFGANLLPGQHFTITTVFEVIANITTTTNTATVSNSIDVLKNPAAQVTDSVVVSNVPTAVTSKYFLATTAGVQSVRLDWATVAEVNITGFLVYRAPAKDFSQAVKVGYKSAQGPSSEYIFYDTLPAHGHWYYWLVAVNTEGNESIVTQAEVLDPFIVYVPFVRR